MDFDWTPEQLSFRKTVRSFLAENLPPDWETRADGPASEMQSEFAEVFCGKMAQAGLLVPHWPARWGGRDADAWTAFILAEEMWMAGEPRGGQYMDDNWLGDRKSVVYGKSVSVRVELGSRRVHEKKNTQII